MGSSQKKKANLISAPLTMRDTRAHEKNFAGIQKLLAEKDFESAEEANEFLSSIDINKIESNPETPAEKAQDLMYEAFGAQGKKRITLAKKALEIYPDCADAHVLLADEEAKTLDAAIALFQRGVEAGLRSFPPNWKENWTGSFWSVLETRPYMRAKLGLAECLTEAGEIGQAITHYREMISLNPNDNQGVRYELATLLLTEQKDSEVRVLMALYPEDPSSLWHYVEALLVYRRDGPGPTAIAALEEAFAVNRYVPLFLVAGGVPEQPDTYGFGDASEAIVIIHLMARAWTSTPDYMPWVMGWLADQLRQTPRSASKKRKR